MTILNATEARNRFFEMINLVGAGEEVVVKKNGKPAVKISPISSKRDPKEVRRILANMRKVFAKSKARKYWSVIDTPAWKKKERKYLEKLSRGIVD